MAGGTEPLIARPPSSEHSDDQRLEEEDALLSGERTTTSDPLSSRRRRWRELGIFTWALLATAALIVLAVLYQQRRSSASAAPATPSGKRNLIFMVSDGMGPTSLSLARTFRQHAQGLAADDVLALDGHLIGQSRTRSSSSLVTDSAAGATAFSCGAKSYNGAVSVLPDHAACGTVLEAAKRAGYVTGLVVTTRITDATPACFAAHVNVRLEEDRVAEQLVGRGPLGRVVDLMLGGGRCHFLGNGTAGSCRTDDKDVIAMAREEGFGYVDDRAGFDGLEMGGAVELPLLGLFADTDIPYEVDRRFEGDVYPSLDEMARTAMRALSEATKDSEKGFFLMIEGSRIDHAGHANDPVAQVHEVLAYDKAFASVLEFLDKDGTEGVMVSTSDHETGGLATARRTFPPRLHRATQANVPGAELHPYEYPAYLWYPAVLANATHSSERLAAEYDQHLTTSPDDDMAAYLEQLLASGLGIHDASAEELDLLVTRPLFAPWSLADMVSRRSQTGWSTHGHSAVDVNVYASDAGAARALVGNHENTEVGVFLREYLDVDVEAVTRELREKGDAFDTVDGEGRRISWMGDQRNIEAAEWVHDHLDHYLGDLGKYKRCDVCGV